MVLAGRRALTAVKPAQASHQRGPGPVVPRRARSHL